MIENYLWEQLAAFAKYHTLSEAAKNLYVTQPALSRSMKKLEQIIGVELFTRRKNFIALNDNGKLAADYAKNILEENLRAVEKIRDFDRKSRTISVGCCAPVPMNEIIFLLTQNFPDLSITSELNVDEYLLKGLREKFFDLIVLHQKVEDTEIFSAECGEEKLFLAVPPNHKFANKDGVYLEELNGEKILLYANIGFWHELCKDKAPNAKFLIQSDRPTFKELAESSALLSFTTSVMIEKGYAQKNCKYVPILDIEADVKYYCACKINQLERFKKLFNKINGEHFITAYNFYVFKLRHTYKHLTARRGYGNIAAKNYLEGF